METIFSKRLKDLREDHDETQDDLAKSTGISRSSIVNYEQGTRVPTADVVPKIASHFNVTTDYLFGLTNEPAKHTDTIGAKITALQKLMPSTEKPVISTENLNNLLMAIINLLVVDQQSGTLSVEILSDFINGMTDMVNSAMKNEVAAMLIASNKSASALLKLNQLIDIVLSRSQQ